MGRELSGRAASAASVLGAFALVPLDLPGGQVEAWRELWRVAGTIPGAARFGLRRAAAAAGVSEWTARRLWPRVREGMVACGRWPSHSRKAPRTPYTRGIRAAAVAPAHTASHSGAADSAAVQLTVNTRTRSRLNARARDGGARAIAGRLWWQWSRLDAGPEPAALEAALEAGPGPKAAAEAWEAAGGTAGFMDAARRRGSARGIGVHWHRFSMALAAILAGGSVTRRADERPRVSPGETPPPLITEWTAQPCQGCEMRHGPELDRMLARMSPKGRAELVQAHPHLERRADLSGLDGVNA